MYTYWHFLIFILQSFFVVTEKVYLHGLKTQPSLEGATTLRLMDQKDAFMFIVICYCKFVIYDTKDFDSSAFD